MNKNDVNDFRIILRNFERELDLQNANSCCCGVTTSQCHALMELYILKSAGLAQLSKKLSVDKSTASRTIDNLVSKSLVERRIPKENRRATLLSLSPEGEKVRQQINDNNNEYFLQVLSPVPPEDLKTFISVFEIITSKMKSLNEHLEKPE